MNSNLKLRNMYSSKIEKKIYKINQSFDLVSQYNRIKQYNSEFTNLKNKYNQKISNKLDNMIDSTKMLLNFDREIIKNINNSKLIGGTSFTSTNPMQKNNSTNNQFEFSDIYNTDKNINPEAIINQIVILNSEIETAIKILEGKKTTFQNNCDRISDLEKELATLSTKNDEFIQLNETYKTKIGELETKITTLNDSHKNEITKLNETYDEKINNHNSSLVDNATKIKALEDKIVQLEKGKKDIIHQTESQLNKINEKLKNTTENINKLNCNNNATSLVKLRPLGDSFNNLSHDERTKKTENNLNLFKNVGKGLGKSLDKFKSIGN